MAAPERATEGSGSYSASAASSATRLEIAPREKPQSVSVVTRMRIDDFALTSANELLSSVTGVNGLLSGTGNPSATVDFVRKRPTEALQASAPRHASLSLQVSD